MFSIVFPITEHNQSLCLQPPDLSCLSYLTITTQQSNWSAPTDLLRKRLHSGDTPKTEINRVTQVYTDKLRHAQRHTQTHNEGVITFPSPKSPSFRFGNPFCHPQSSWVAFILLLWSLLCANAENDYFNMLFYLLSQHHSSAFVCCFACACADHEIWGKRIV